MNHKELKAVAAQFNIPDIDSLSYKDLKSKVSQAKKADDTEDSLNDGLQHSHTTKSGSDENPTDIGSELDTDDTLFIDQSGRKYGFTLDAPDKFRYNNLVKTKEEWLEDQDAMEQLALGNCSFVEQIID